MSCRMEISWRYIFNFFLAIFLKDLYETSELQMMQVHFLEMISVFSDRPGLIIEAIPIWLGIIVYQPGSRLGINYEGYEMISMFVTGFILVGISVFIKKMTTTD
jgi:hypothetical protein